MNVFLISVNVLLWIWQFSQFRKKQVSIRDQVVVYSLYAITLSLCLMNAKNWLNPYLLRPFVSMLEQVNQWLGVG